MTASTVERFARRTPGTVIAHQLRYDLIDMSRNRQARFFAIAMPIGFLLLFCAIFGNATLPAGGHTIRESTYYVASLTTYGIVDVGFMALVISTVEARENGLLRRRQMTPQPAWTIVASRTIGAVLSSAALAAVLLVIGRVAYGASLSLGSLLPLTTAVLVGCIAFVSLGFAASTVVRSSQSAQPMAMALAMPLFFISGVFVPWADIPPWLRDVADIFPVRNEALAVLNPFINPSGSAAWSVKELLIVAVWAIAGLVVAVRRFGWLPQDG
jgi:ABC-2 type transport system permease protein